MSIAALASVLALASVPAPPPPGARALLTWTAGEMRCGDVPVTPRAAHRPRLALGWSTMTAPDVTLRFAIDAAGRVTDVVREGEGYAAYADDLAPALVANRFAAGAPQRACRVTYAARRVPIESAPIPDLVSYTLDPQSGALPPAGWARIGAGGDCAREPRPAPLRRDYPAFDTLPATPGARDWSMIGYDTDAHGKPVNVAVRWSTGNAALDAASAAAVASSRFTAGARTGCLYPYWRTAQRLSPPLPPPEEATLRPAGATCPAERAWATPPRLTFPEPYRRRMIEGWAVMAYDVAPWGEIGNIRVLAAQPSADFGTQATSVLRGARLAPSAAGHTGCVDRVLFRIGALGDPANLPDPAAPPPF